MQNDEHHSRSNWGIFFKNCNYEYIWNPSLEHKRSPIKLLPKSVNGVTRPNPTTFKSKGGLSVVNSNKPSTKTSSTQLKVSLQSFEVHQHWILKNKSKTKQQRKWKK